jgi:alkylresorcinol/alkylpyrone synthase
MRPAVFAMHHGGKGSGVTTLTAVQAVVPPHRYRQAEITEAFAQACGLPSDLARTAGRLHHHAAVAHRHLALPLERYAELGDFTRSNELFLRCATDLACQAVDGALQRAGLSATDVDAIVSTTVTGIAVPSLDARMAGRIGMRPDVVRVPLFGLGCVAGVAGVARLHDYLSAHPDQVGVLVAVELCSLTLQRGDPSVANLVASGLFGDGAAAVVAVGAERRCSAGPRPSVVAARSHLYPDTLRTMGFDVGRDGFRIVLDAGVPALVRQFLGRDVRSFLSEHGLAVGSIDRWITHPGGPKVIDAVEAELGLGPEALVVTRRSLAEVGNLSSASVLHVLADTMHGTGQQSGDTALMIAMGPGFCSELVLLQW